MKTHRKNKKIKKKYKKTKNTRKNPIGGRAIDAGSYGCVFKPAIKCVDSTIPYDSNTISKLMEREDTESELAEIAKVKKFIETIPDKEKYFLLSNTYACNPAELNEEDKSHFNEKCGLFTKNGINSNNVNDDTNLNKLGLIVMPNGGVNIEDYFMTLFKMPKKDMYKKFIAVNTALIKLLANGIMPLTLKGFNHYDIKAGNILMAEDGNARLIDWGLAGENDGIHIPETIQNRSIAFNMPFSDIFFNNYVKTWLPSALNKIKSGNQLHDKNTGQAELLKIVAVNMINESIERKGEGHYDYIIGIILHKIYKIYASKNVYNRLDYNVLSENVLIEYVQAVLLKFVDGEGNFNDTRYFYEVFAKNVDVWGLLLAYVPIIEYGLDKIHIDIINGICRILLKYCFSPEFAIKPIFTENANELMRNELILELQSLNAIASELMDVSIKRSNNISNRTQKK